jgi:hypothetical protein
MAAVLVQQTPPPPTVKPPLQTSAKSTEAEITLTGCLVQGSASNVFILQNAKRDPQSATEKAARYVVAPATEDLVLKQHLNHQVRILGVPDGRPQPTPQTGAAVDEKLVPTLNAKSLTMVSASCGAGGGGDWSEADASSGDAPETSPVPGSSQGGPSDVHSESESDSELEAVPNWATPSLNHPFDGAATVPTSRAIETPMDHPAPPTTTALLGDNGPGGGSKMSPAGIEAPIGIARPRTLLIIASGLLLVVYAGRPHEWRAFGRRSAR